MWQASRESRWASFLQKLYTSQKQYLSKPEIVDLRVVDSQSGKRVEGGIPGGGFRVEATIKGANVLWVKSVHGKRVSDNGGGIVLIEKGYVLDPEFYKKK